MPEKRVAHSARLRACIGGKARNGDKSTMAKTPTTPATEHKQAFTLGTLPAHPRLFARPEDWARVRRLISPGPEQDKRLAAVYGEILGEADKMLAQPLSTYELEGKRLLAVSREVVQRIGYLSVVYRMSGEKKYAERAIAELKNVCAFKDWNDVFHYLDTAEMAFAVAIGYDWLYDELDPETRGQLETAMVRHALANSLEPDAEGKVRWWIAADNNWNQVCHGGLVTAALAVGDLDAHRALSEQIIRRALDNLGHAAEAYAPDGAYQEGPMYWSYGTSYHVLLADALRSATGSTHGAEAYPGFLESGTFLRQATAPTGQYFNYADCRLEGVFNLPLFWMAMRSGEASVLKPELEKMKVGELSKFFESSRFSPFLLFWYRPELVARAEQATDVPDLVWRGRGRNPIVVMRTAFDDPKALFAGIKGGSPSLNHAHMDGGSFIMEADGVRWAMDLGLQDYYSLEKEGVNLWDRDQDSERWTVFRLGAESHNIPRFGSAPQQVEGDAKLVAYHTDGKKPGAVFDLTSLYDGHVKKLHRGLRMLDGQAVLVQDEWDSGDAHAEYAWQMMTGAEVKAEGDRWVLSKDGQKLEVILLDADGVSLECVEADTLLRPFDVKNPGVKRLTARLPEGVTGPGRFRVLLVPGSSGEVAAPAFTPLAGWPGKG